MNNVENYKEAADHKLDGVYSNGKSLEMTSSIATSITENNLTRFKRYLDDPDSAIQSYIGENGIVYSYDTKFYVYTYDPEGELVNTDGSTLESTENTSFNTMGNMGQTPGVQQRTSGHFGELMPGSGGRAESAAP